LGSDPTTKLFSAYNEADPRTIVGGTANGFFLNFNQFEGIPMAGTVAGTTPGSIAYAYAGNKVIFGDLGNNWLVGGNGASNLFGGYGNDMLDVRRTMTIDNGHNDLTDNNASPNFEGLAFAGGGVSTLIAGGSFDRLIGWGGNLNTFIVPFA